MSEEYKRLTRKQAIRKKCLDCVCGQWLEVKLCPSKDCPLWTYRLGYEVDFKTGEKIPSKIGFASRTTNNRPKNKN